MERRFSGAAAEARKTAKSKRMLAARARLEESVTQLRAFPEGTRFCSALLSPHLRAELVNAVVSRLKPLRVRLSPIQILIERIDGQSAEELGVEVGGFLGHDLAGEGDVADLLHAARIHQESDIGVRAVCVAYLRQGLGSIADVGDVLLVADRFLGKVQDLFQQTLVQLDHVQRLLADG